MMLLPSYCLSTFVEMSPMSSLRWFRGSPVAAEPHLCPPRRGWQRTSKRRVMCGHSTRSCGAARAIDVGDPMGMDGLFGKAKEELSEHKDVVDGAIDKAEAFATVSYTHLRAHETD